MRAGMLLRSFVSASVLVLVAATLVALVSAPATASPVATTEESYQAFGRVFPDPHGCLPAEAPGVSPWAKGDVCAAQFVQWTEALDGLQFLEDRFPRFLQVLNLRTQLDHLDALDGEALQSAGLPTEDLGRDRRDLRVIRVTDEDSPVPEADRQHFAYALSIHGIERAGLEGGIRAIEDLVSWAACEHGVGDGSPVCEDVPAGGMQILEPADTDPSDPSVPPEAGPTAGEALSGSVVYFVLANPDGWHRGEYSEGQVFFQRYNGNGMDLNRDWPSIGYTEAQYTPFSEPETRGYGKYLRHLREQNGPFAGAIDLHGMVTAEAFSYTLLGAGQRDLRKNALTVDTSVRTFRDSETRLAWSPLIAPAEDCPQGPQEPAFGGNLIVCSDQWGTVWDTIDYQVTGSFGDWMDSPMGLDAVGIDNEMYMSHLAPNNVFEPGLEQLHIDGNKGLIFSQIASLLDAQEVTYDPGGVVGYAFDPQRVEQAGGDPATPPTADMPTQDDLELTEVAGEGVTFEVEGPADGVFNGGMSIEATFTNARGISPATAGALVLEYCEPMHPGDPEGECQEVARYFNQSFAYLQAGARIDLNDPAPGTYRIQPNPTRTVATTYHVAFHDGPSHPVPEQVPVDASRMDFFSELNGFVPDGAPELQAVRVEDVLADPTVLDRLDTFVATDELMPGFVPADQERPAVPSEPAGQPQASETFTVTAGAPEAVQEFEVRDTAEDGTALDNDRLTVAATWEVPSDYDLFVERFDDATGEWAGQGAATNFVNQGETVEVSLPEPGRWRFRIVNFAAAPQPVEVTVSYDALPREGSDAVTSAWTEAEFATYATALRDWVVGGGNLVLTDAAIAGLPAVVDGFDANAVTGGFFYAGWMDFDDGSGTSTYDRHPLAADVDKPGAAEGEATVAGTTFDNRHQTYEPVPLGYYVSPSGAGNASCTSDQCDAPNWVVDHDAWTAAGGTVAARTFARESTAPGAAGTTGVSLGELPIGEGVVRVAGALLPDPTLGNHHPFGLADYALTYTGYQVFDNLTAYENPNRQDQPPAPSVDLDCGDCAVTVRAGETGEQAVTVHNTGDVVDTYALTAAGPEGWDATAEPAEVTVEPGESATVVVTVSPPRSAQRGDEEVTVTATSTGFADVSGSAAITVSVTKGPPSDPGGGRAAEAPGATAAGGDTQPAGAPDTRDAAAAHTTPFAGAAAVLALLLALLMVARAGARVGAGRR